MADDRDLAGEAQKIIDAASRHQVNELRLLLRTGSANVQDPETGYSPLHAAIAALGPKDQAYTIAEGQKDDDQDGSALNSSNLHAGHSVSEAAKQAIALLLQNGAIWNDLDKNGETPGCVAYRLGWKELYDMMVDAGFRAEILLNRLDEYEVLDDGSDEVDDEAEERGERVIDQLRGDSLGEEDDAAESRKNGLHDFHEEPEATTGFPDRTGVELTAEPEESSASNTGPDSSTAPSRKDDLNSAYLHSNLTFSPHRILDEEKNGVMMSWESEIMRRTAALLCSRHAGDASDPVSEQRVGHARDEEQLEQQEEESRKGLRILNVGHGMGIIDECFQRYSPAAHHIVEAHLAVLEKMRGEGWMSDDTAEDDDPIFKIPSTTNPPASDSSPPPPSSPQGDTHRKRRKNVKVHQGTWQTVLPALVEENKTFDAIFFDTFAEDYAAFKEFFREYVVALLEPGRGTWSFFNGLGADRRVCYDVYTKVR